MSTPRARFLALVIEQMGAPYRWGSKGQVVRPGIRTFDCSGLVTWALHKVGGPDWRATHNTDRLWDECRRVDAPQPGDVVLYGAGGARPNPNHVMVCLSDGLVLGASGGGSRTLTLADAEAQGARVKVFTSADYRPDRLGFRALPFP